MSATDTERDAVVVLRFRRARNNATLKAELRRASKQQRVVARAVPYQRYDYTVEEYAAHRTVQQKIKHKLNSAAIGLSSPTHESSSYKDDGIGLDCAISNCDQMAPGNRGKHKKKAPNAKRKKRGKQEQAHSTVDELRPTTQQLGRNMKCFHEHMGSSRFSSMDDPEEQSVQAHGRIGTMQSKYDEVHSTNAESAITASKLKSDTLHPDSRAAGQDVPSSVVTDSEKSEPIPEIAQAGYSLVDAPGQQPLSEILERKRMYSSLNRRLDDERLEISRTRAQLRAIHKEMKTNNSPTERPLLTTEAILACCDDVDPNARVDTKVNDSASTDRVSTAERVDDSCGGLLSRTRGEMTINKKATLRRASDTDTAIDSSNGATTDTHKELYDVDGAMGIISTNELGFDRHILFERTWGPGSCDTKEVVPSSVGQKSRGNIGLSSWETKTKTKIRAKIKAKIKHLLRVRGKDHAERPLKEINRTINAWSDSVKEPWELTRREDLNWGKPHNQWIDEWGVDIKNTIIPGSLAGKALTNNVRSSHVPKLSDFRNKEELWQYLHPENVGNAPHDQKSMSSDGGSYSAPSSNITLYKPAELPAYEEVISADARMLLGTVESRKGKSKASAYCSTSFPQTKPIRPEDLWLYTPRSCTTCGDFGLLPLHYCTECRKLRIDMCSECYGMGHDSCQRDGHEVAERQMIQQLSRSANEVGTSLPMGAASEQRPQKTGLPQSMEQLLTFLTEERSFMRGEIERVRSENTVAKVSAARDAAEATAFRTAKLKLLPTLVTDGKVASLKEQKSSSSIKNFVSTHSDSKNKDERQLSGKDEIPRRQPEEASADTNTLKKPPEQPIHEENVVSSRVPKLPFPAADAPQPLDSDRELIDMDARLRKQEQLQGFRERELCLREKGQSLRERELLLDLKERELFEPGYVPTKTLPRESTGCTTTSTMSTSTGPSKCATTQTAVPRSSPDATTQVQSSVLESPASYSETSMPTYSPSSSNASPPYSPIIAKQAGFPLSTIIIKHLLSKIFVRAPRKGIRTHAEKRSRPSGSSEYAVPAKKSKSGTSPSGRKRAGKLPLSRSHSARSDKSGTDSGSNKRRRKGSVTKAVPGRLLVCPYAKYDPYRYSSSNTAESHYRRCGSHTLRDIPRLKQHLYRVHQRPEFHCPRCYSEFGSMTESNEHARQPTQCATAPCPYPEKIDNDQLRELKRRQQGKNEAEYWFFIFKILFPGAVLPADPYEEDLGTRLATQLGSYGASNRFANMVTGRAGTMDDETQLRVRQAIEELLPVFVQQVLQQPVISAHSSSTSLPRSSITPESSPGDERMVAEDHMIGPNLHPTDAPQDVGNPTFLNEQRTLLPTTPFTMTNSASPSHDDLEASAAAHNYCQPSVRRTTERQQPDNFHRLGGQNATIFVPVLKTTDQRDTPATLLRPGHVDVQIMAPPPIPQHALPDKTLLPKGSRRSMDSGYASMYTRQSDAVDGAGFGIYNEVAPTSADNLFAADYPGNASEESRWNFQQDPHWPWNDTAGPNPEPTSSLNNLRSGANKRDLVPDLPGSRMSSAEQDPAIPGSYPQESHSFCRPTLDFSDPYLSSTNNTSQDDGSDTPSLYETIEELWAAVDNPWREDDSMQDGGVA